MLIVGVEIPMFLVFNCYEGVARYTKVLTCGDYQFLTASFQWTFDALVGVEVRWLKALATAR